MALADTALAMVCFVCFAIGTPANVISLRYFLRKTHTVPTCIYIAVTTLDTMVLPVGLTLADNRNSLMFSNKAFCSIWGITWEFIPYYTVFLVFCLSVLRTIALLRPLTTISKKWVVGVLIVYAVFLMLRQLMGVVLGYSNYQFDENSGYCWNYISNQDYQVSDVVFSAVQVTFPIIPIIVSCIASTLAITLSNKTTKISPSATKMKKQATITIILVTLVYILFNIPAVINYTRYVAAVYFTGEDFLASGTSSSAFLQRYIWLLVFVMTVALNSLANPVVYFMRMEKFRSEALKMLKKKGGRNNIKIYAQNFNLQ